MIDEKHHSLQRIILAASITGLVSISPSCANVWTGYEVFTFPISFLGLLISTILIFAKIRAGYFLLLFISLVWAIQLTDYFGWFITFGTSRTALIFLLLIPFCTFLLLIPLVTKFLAWNNSFGNIFLTISILTTVSFPVYAVIDRMNRDYMKSVFAEFKVQDDGSILIICKPQPSDTREFYLKTESKELIPKIKESGTFLHDYYYVSNTLLKVNFNFHKLESISLVKLEDKKIQPEINWAKEEIEGNTSFLQR